MQVYKQPLINSQDKFEKDKVEKEKKKKERRD